MITSGTSAEPMRLLYVTPDIGWPLSFGGDIRKWHLLQGLRQAGTVDALVFTRAGRTLRPEPFAGCRAVMDATDPGLSAAERRQYDSTVGRGLLALGRGLPFEYLGFDRTGIAEALPPDLRFDAYDLVWFARARHALSLVDRVPCPTVLDGDDFEYVREGMLLGASAWYGAKIWNYLNVVKLWWLERGHADRFTCVARSSAADAARHPAANVVAIPNGTTVPDAVDRTPDARLLFIGDLGYAPNHQGLVWFLERIWPIVRARIPDARLDLVGRHASPDVERLDGTVGVTLHGFVPDLAAVYRTTGLSIVPLLAGSGTRLKILEALARAVPVVSTTVGAAGIDAGSSDGVDRADTPEAFADRCVAMLGSLEEATNRARRGRALVADRYDWRAIERQVRDLVGDVHAGTFPARRGVPAPALAAARGATEGGP